MIVVCRKELFLRVVEFQWDVCITTTRDCTVVVLDGGKVMLTGNPYACMYMQWIMIMML